MKVKRHQKIIEIIGEFNIETQDDLIEKLRNHGFEVTQATISRDIRELKLVKIAFEGGRYKYALPYNEDVKISAKYRSILRETIVNVDCARNIVVIKTYSGMANATAAAIDAMDWSDVVGSIAGDDTVLMVMRSDEKAQELASRIKKVV